MGNDQMSSISSTLVYFPEGKRGKTATLKNADVKVNATTAICPPKLRKCTINDAGCKHFSLIYTPEVQFPFSNSGTANDSQ